MIGARAGVLLCLLSDIDMISGSFGRNVWLQLHLQSQVVDAFNTELSRDIEVVASVRF
jgi:hypothetical protein